MIGSIVSALALTARELSPLVRTKPLNFGVVRAISSILSQGMTVGLLASALALMVR